MGEKFSYSLRHATKLSVNFHTKSGATVHPPCDDVERESIWMHVISQNVNVAIVFAKFTSQQQGFVTAFSLSVVLQVGLGSFSLRIGHFYFNVDLPCSKQKQQSR